MYSTYFFSRGLVLLLCLSGAYAQFSRGTFQSSKKQDGGSSADQSQVNKIPELINTWYKNGYWKWIFIFSSFSNTWK